MEDEASITIRYTMENELLSACRLRLPYETCGIIYGTVSKSGKQMTADGFSLIRNASPSPLEAFSFHPEDWVSVFFQAQKNQRDIVGYFHTHPQGTRLPSPADESGSIPWGTYWIISFAAGDSEIAVYHRDSTHRWAILPIKRVL